MKTRIFTGLFGLLCLFVSGCLGPQSGIQWVCDGCGKSFGDAGRGAPASGLVSLQEHEMRQVAFCSQRCKTVYMTTRGIQENGLALKKPTRQQPIQEGDFVLTTPIPCLASCDGYILKTLRFTEEGGVVKVYYRISYPCYPEKEWNMYITILDAQGRTVASFREWNQSPGEHFKDWKTDDRERSDEGSMATTPHGEPMRYKIEIKSSIPLKADAGMPGSRFGPGGF